MTCNRKNPLGIVLAIFLSFFIVTFSPVDAVSKKSRKVSKAHRIKPAKKPKKVPKINTIKSTDIAVHDANIMSYQKKAETLFEEHDYEAAVAIMLKVYNYAEDVLSIAKLIRSGYQKAQDMSHISIDQREDLAMRSERLDGLIIRYTGFYEASTFNLGYLYYKLKDTGKARKYLMEYIETVPHSDISDEYRTTAERLLMESYNLKENLRGLHP